MRGLFPRFVRLFHYASILLSFIIHVCVFRLVCVGFPNISLLRFFSFKLQIFLNVPLLYVLLESLLFTNNLSDFICYSEMNKNSFCAIIFFQE